MNKEVAKARITKKGFRAWLQRRRNGFVYNRYALRWSCMCPLSRYMTAETGAPCSVGPHVACLQEGYVKLPIWAQNFVRSVDVHVRVRHRAVGRITPAECINILDRL